MKQVFEKLAHVLLCGAFCLSGVDAFASFDVYGLKVTPVEPIGVVIDYNVSGTPEADGYAPEVTLKLSDGTEIVAKTLFGQLDTSAGVHRIYWNMAKDGIDAFTNATISVTYKEAPYCVIDLSGGVDATSYPVTYLAAEPAGGFNTYEYKTTNIVLKLVKAGSFIMGEDQTNEAHRVTLTQPFYLGLFTVTMGQKERITTVGWYTDSDYLYVDTPEIHPQWGVHYWEVRGNSDGTKWPASDAVDADSFLGKLRAKTDNLLFDLPTEAQWEYACRAGTTTKYSYGDNVNGDYMWYSGNSGRQNYYTYSRTNYEVGLKKANPWGFYDMHGNVWEWCLDWHAWELAYGKDPKGATSGSSRVLRGGTWQSSASDCTSSTRAGSPPSAPHDMYAYYCFRLSRTISTPLPSVLPASAKSVSANVRRDGSSIGAVTFNSNLIEGTTTTITIDGEAVDSSCGSYAWLPNKVGEKHTITYTIDGSNTFSAVYTAAERAPAITDVQARKVAPFGVAIDYAYTTPMEGTTGQYEPAVSAITSDGATTYVAKTLTKTLDTGTNKKRVYWNMAKDGVVSLTNAKIGVQLKDAQRASDVLYAESGVDTSVVLDGSTITGEMTIDLRQTDDTAAYATADGARVQMKDTMTAVYRPTSNGAHTLSHVVGDAVMSVVYHSFDLPPLTLGDVSASKIGAFGLAIDYTVTNVMAAAEGYVPEVTLTPAGGATNIVAKTVTGQTDSAAGAHRICWDLAKDGVDSFEGATVSVTYKAAPYCVIDLSGGKDATSYPVTYLASEPEGGFTNDAYKTTNFVLKLVKAGSFVMGEDQTSGVARTDHKVTLTKPFYMGLFEVTQKQWELVMGSNPSLFSEDGAKRPVEKVSYNDIRGSVAGANGPESNAVDADSFLGKLRAKTGRCLFDLPTEAQWEYTCRADTTTVYGYGDTADGAYMWYRDNSKDDSKYGDFKYPTHEVGTTLPNEWGFYDMHGNVGEWCLDWYADALAYSADPKGTSSGTNRVARGGNSKYYAIGCTSSYRDYNAPSTTYADYGFRLSGTIPSPDVTPVAATGVSAQKPACVVITPPDGNFTTSFEISDDWFVKYPTLGGTTVAEWQKIAEGAGVKTNASGVAAPVWHDYVAGTDPTNAASKFTAKIEMKDGVPSITWDPALNGEGVREGNLRTYRVWGKANLGDESWSEVSSGAESGYNFFRVTVEMP